MKHFCKLFFQSMRLPQFWHTNREYVTAVFDTQRGEIDICAALLHTVESATVPKNYLARQESKIDYLNFYL